MNNILIYGPPASGKTYFGKMLSEIFNVKHIDLDEEITSRTGDSIEQIIDMLGEEGFRKVESDIFEDLIFTYDNAIISLGGGTLLNEANRKIAELENTVICLNLEQHDLENNFIRDWKKRPLCKNGIEQYRSLLKTRQSHYQSFKHHVTGMLIDQQIEVENGLSNIFIGKLNELVIAKIVSVLFQHRKIAIVYDINVEKIANNLRENISKAKLFSGIFYGIKAQEKNKTIETVYDVIKQFDKEQLNRNDIVISVGGGITSDIVGFATSIWKRGIRWISIPTTLLSMVDASIGGKTGVNYNDAKNILGTFHKPTCVFINHDFLLSLDEDHLIEGYAESYKHYLLDSKLQSFVNGKIVKILKDIGKAHAENDLTSFRNIAKILNVKIQTVIKDPFEKSSIRARLNLGHTVAHALEIKTKHKISHGKAVAIGICEEMRLALNEGILKDENILRKVEYELSSLGLPISLPKNISFDDLLQIMHKDKKNNSSSIRFVLLEDLGKTMEFLK